MIATESDLALHGLNILVTRPQHQAEAICRLIESHGGNAIRFPSMEISATEIDTPLANCIGQLGAYDIAIFISANAVDYGLNLVSSWPPKTAIAAVGASTARALQRHGLRASIVPAEFNSEALLAMSEMQDMSGKRVLIFRGVGGREHLAEQLIQRGAKVDYAECYHRVLATPSQEQQRIIKQLCQRDELDVVLATSNESLENLFSLFDAENRLCLLKATIIGVSQRLLPLAHSLGLHKPRIASQPSDVAIVDEIIAWRGETLAAVSVSH